MLHDCILLNHGSRYIYMQPCLVHSTKLCRVPLVRLGNQEWPEERTTDGNTAHVYGKNVFVWLPTDTASTQYELLPFVFISCIHFGKIEVAYRHHGPASYGSAWCSCTLESHILPNISPCYYQGVQLTHVDELYGECNRTARACTHSGYQALLSDFFERLGMRLGADPPTLT